MLGTAKRTHTFLEQSKLLRAAAMGSLLLRGVACGPTDSTLAFNNIPRLETRKRDDRLRWTYKTDRLWIFKAGDTINELENLH